MLMELLLSDIEVDNYICSDINIDLINLWNEIKNNPNEVANNYEIMWHELNDKDDDKQRKKEYFNKIRLRFNKNRDTSDFMFLMRTCVNGMPRYNKKGWFNTSFHITRNGINPKTLRNVINFWATKLNEKNVKFISGDYSYIEQVDNDFMYLDPPYFNTKGMYYGSIDMDLFIAWLSKQSKYILSFDGKLKNKDFTYDFPTSLYTEHVYLDSGNSSFRRLKTDDKYQNVKESLYIMK